MNDMNERKKFTTKINVRELAQYVEDLVANVRVEHGRGRVTLWRTINADDVLAFGRFYVG